MSPGADPRFFADAGRRPRLTPWSPWHLDPVVEGTEWRCDPAPLERSRAGG